ncbi:MAG: DUF2442 domain-containing protein [Cryomorphaceae bacterium]|nr:DUF2442 domain-containing protein [Flavobacteriales bacterium]
MNYTDIKIKAVTVIRPFVIELEFNDGSLKTVDLEKVLHGNLFGPLQNPELFRQVRLNAEIETIEWPNGADFHPETLYRWEEYKDELAAVAAKWQKTRKAG